jgi:small conductance mechanosensitive channel
METVISRETLQQAQEFIVRQGIDWAINIAAAIAIFIVGRWIGKRIVGLVKRALLSSHVDRTLATFLANILNTLVLMFVVIAAISKLGVETSSLAAIFAAAGLAIGLAWQGSLSNLAAGIMIITFRPFNVGDFVEAGGVSGVVEEVSIFTTTMKTPDNKEVIVPNGSITSSTITNYSSRATRRIDCKFTVAAEQDIFLIKQLLTEAMMQDARVLNDPEPMVAMSEVKDNTVTFVVRPWVKTADYWEVYYALNEAVIKTFDAHDILFPATAKPAAPTPKRIAP